MSEENKSVENLHGDDAQTVENEMQVQHEQAEQKDEQVPLSALQSERAHRQQLAEELQMLKEHVSLMNSRQESQKQASDPFDQWSDDDIPTVGEIKKLFKEREKQFQTSLTELQMAQRHPDYADVITQHLPEVIKQNPSLKKTLEQTQDYELAYYLAKNSDSYRKQTQSTKRNLDAERILKNTQQSGSLSSMGSTSPINTAKKWKEMSDADFRKEMSKNMGLI